MKRLQKFTLCLLILLAMLTVGCAQTLKTWDRVADNDVLTMTQGEITNPKFITAWPTFSGYFKGLLGVQRDYLLPKEVLDGWKELDDMSAKQISGTKLTDEEMAYFVSTKFGRVLTPVTRAVLQRYVPPSVWAWLTQAIGLAI